MEKTFFGKVVSFLSDHFELLISVNGSILLLFLIVFIALKLRDIDLLKVLYKAFKSALYIIVVIGQFSLFILFGYLYWENYQRPAPPLHLDEHVSASTQWVKNNTRIYFIDNKALRSIKINDRDSEIVFSGSDPVREYHFSPDGKRLLVLTQQDLFLVNRKTKQSQRIDTIKELVEGEDQEKAGPVKGSISGIQWAPDSQKFVYEIARWSKFSAQDSVYLYDLKKERKRAIRSPARRISSLYWDKQSESLYYLYHEARDPMLHASAYEVKVFRISTTTLTLELITRIPSEDLSVPIDSLNLRDIDLFLDGDKLSFGGPAKESDLVSDKGSLLGFDEDDCLYFVNSKWFRKRLYKISREPRNTEIPRYQYKGGDLVIDHIRWIPGGRYVIMEHRYWGVLILEPSTGKMGLLIRASGHTFGWYPKAV